MDSNNTLRICKSYKERFDKLTTLMEYPEFNVDYNFSKKYLKELSDIKPIVDLYNTYLEFSDEKDRDLIIQDINKELLKGRHDEYDGIVIEVYSKDKEAANFVLTSYFNYFKSNEYNVDLQKDKLIVYGASIYSLYKVETGTHIYLNHKEAQVQVLVLPYKDIDSYTVSLRDLKVDYFHSSGAGGQNINKVETAVRMTHIETGIVVQCQDERSQLKNKEKAMKVLASRLYDLYRAEKDAAYAENRRAQVGSGERNERIRTYNFPQGRVTDHRANLTLYQIDAVMDGDLDAIIDALILKEQAEKLKGLTV